MYIYLRDKSARTLNLSLQPLPPSPPKRMFSTKMTFWTQKKIEFMHPYQIFQFWIFRVPFGNFFNAGRKGKPHKILFWPVVPLRGVGGIGLCHLKCSTKEMQTVNSILWTDPSCQNRIFSHIIGGAVVKLFFSTNEKA